MPLSKDPAKRARQLANLRAAPPAPTGHARSVSHGAYAQISAATLDEKTLEIVSALTADAPVRAGDGSLPAADAPAVRLLAECLCRLDNIGEYLQRKGWEGEDGKPRPVLDYEAKLRSHALELLRDLGMTPAARAKLGLDLARTHRTLEEEIAANGQAWQQEPEVIDATASDISDEPAGV